MKSSITVFAIIIIFIACKNHNNTFANNTSTLTKDAISSEPYYPISDYIRSQVAYVDTMPLAIDKLVFENGTRIDSNIIDRPTFNKMAEEFAEPNLNLNAIKPLYKENMYNDLSMNSLTFTYDTKDPNQELQQATVLINPDTKKVKNIIFKKTRISGDTTITLNGLWKNNMNFQINYTLQPKVGVAIERQVKVIWDRPIRNEY
jgi:hypothetical protein